MENGKLFCVLCKSLGNMEGRVLTIVKKRQNELIGAIGSILCCSSTEKVECPQDSPKGGQRLRGEAEHFSYSLGKA